MSYDYAHSSKEVVKLQEAIAAIQQKLEVIFNPAVAYYDKEHVQKTGWGPWKKTTSGVIRTYFQVGKAQEFLSDADLEQKDLDRESVVAALRKEEADAAAALHDRIAFEEALAAAKDEGAETERLAMINAALEVDPELLGKVASVGNRATADLRAVALKRETLNEKERVATIRRSAAEKFGYTREA